MAGGSSAGGMLVFSEFVLLGARVSGDGGLIRDELSVLDWEVPTGMAMVEGFADPRPVNIASGISTCSISSSSEIDGFLVLRPLRRCRACGSGKGSTGASSTWFGVFFASAGAGNSMEGGVAGSSGFGDGFRLGGAAGVLLTSGGSSNISGSGDSSRIDSNFEGELFFVALGGTVSSRMVSPGSK